MINVDLEHSVEKLSEDSKDIIRDIKVSIQGDRTRKTATIVTLHDIGQNHLSCFQSFFCFHQFKPLLDKFTVYHLNFPGQHENADELPLDYVYPTMQEIAEMVEEVVNYYGLKNIICFGVGAGANVFTRLALKNPTLVECLILVNGTVTQSTWSEWGYEKMTSHHLKTKGMTQFCQDYLLWHYFGRIDERTNQDLVGLVRDQLNRVKHPRNLALFIESYAWRSAIRLLRPVPGTPPVDTLKSGVLLMCGARSPMVDDTVDMNSKLDPSNSSWMKIDDASTLVLEEQPTVVSNAIINFLQGYGHALKVRAPALSFSSPDEICPAPSVC